MAATQGSRTREASRAGTYPPAPWRIAGPTVICPALVPVEVARAHVPADVDIVPVAPGRTAGGFLLARYEGGSTLHYGELLVFPGLTRVRGSVGVWVSHAYVDSPASLAGGRRMWGVPKDLATFDWADGRVRLTGEAGEHLMTATFPQPRRRLRLPSLLASNGTTGGDDRRRFIGTGPLRMAPARIDVDVAPGAPFAGLPLDGDGRVAFAGHADFRLRAPRLL